MMTATLPPNATSVPNFNLALAKEFRESDPAKLEFVKLSALRCIGTKDCDYWKELGVDDINELAHYRYGQWAWALKQLSAFQEEGVAGAGPFLGMSPIRHMIAPSHKDYHKAHTINDILQSEVTLFIGLGEKRKALLNHLDISTINDLATYAPFETARALVQISQSEKAVRQHYQFMYSKREHIKSEPKDKKPEDKKHAQDSAAHKRARTGATEPAQTSTQTILPGETSTHKTLPGEQKTLPAERGEHDAGAEIEVVREESIGDP